MSFTMTTADLIPKADIEFSLSLLRMAAPGEPAPPQYAILENLLTIQPAERQPAERQPAQRA